MLAGVNVQPQGLQVAPNLIFIGPYDTQIQGQVGSSNRYITLSRCIYKNLRLSPGARNFDNLYKSWLRLKDTVC